MAQSGTWASILDELEDQLPDEADDELPPLDLPDTGPVPTITPAPSLVLGEMEVPATIVARHREREAEPAPEPESESEGVVDDATTAEVPSVAAKPEAELAAEPESEAAEDDGGADSEADDQREPPSVDDLFARLRAAGTATVAHGVLEGDLQEGEAEAAATVTAEREPAEPATEAVTAEPEPAEPAAEAVLGEAITQREAALAPTRTKLSRQLKRVLADEQNEVLDRLRQRNATTAADEVLGSPDAHAGTYREAAEDQLWAAAEAGAHAMSNVEGEELHAALEARSVLDRCLDTLTSELVVPLRARLTENLEASGDDPAEAATPPPHHLSGLEGPPRRAERPT